MPIDCPQDTTVVISNTADPCGGEYLSTDCIATPTAITYLSLSANSTQTQINSAFVTSEINQNSRLTALEAGGQVFTDATLDIVGNYGIQASDDKKFIYIESAVNTPTISLPTSLPNGFECYFFANNFLDERVNILPEYDDAPLFTVPFANMQPETTLKDYGLIHVVKRNDNLYTVNGDLYYYAT